MAVSHNGSASPSVDVGCVVPLTSMYSTVSRPGKFPLGSDWSVPEEANALWAKSACPWEEVRHSGYFSNILHANAALHHAAVHACPKLSLMHDLRGHRLYFHGDSLVREWAESFLCRLRLTHRVIADNMTWGQPRNHRFGLCTNFGGLVHPSLRHCMMGSGCVHFEKDIVVCYQLTNKCAPRLISDEPFWEWLSDLMHRHGAGKRTAVMLTHGTHMSCTKEHWKSVDATTSQLALKFLALGAKDHRTTKVPKSKLLLVYKALDATHFPTQQGEYNSSATLGERSRWKCHPIPPGERPPELRRLELKYALPAIRDLPVPRAIIDTYDADRRDAAFLHSDHAKVPSHTVPVDCLHWMLPGVPDVWSTKLLEVLSHSAQNVTNALPPCAGRDSKKPEFRWWCPPPQVPSGSGIKLEANAGGHLWQSKVLQDAMAKARQARDARIRASAASAKVG